MPDRAIRKGYLASRAVSLLRARSEMIFIRVLLEVDDCGLLSADPEYLRGHLGPAGFARERDIKRALRFCAKAVDEEGVPLIRLYEVGGKPYLQVQKFGQRLDKGLEAKCPLPEWGMDSEEAVPKNDFVIVYEIFKTDWRVAQLSAEDQCFLFRLLLVVDKYGYYHAEAASLNSAIYPQKSGMAPLNCKRSLDNCEQAELVRCEKSGRRNEYVRVLGLSNVSRNASRSKFLRAKAKAPPGDEGQGKLPLNGSPPEDVNNSEGGNGIEGNGKETPISSPRGACTSKSDGQSGRRERADAKALYTFMVRQKELQSELRDMLYPGGCAHPKQLAGEELIDFQEKRSELKVIEEKISKLGGNAA